MCGLNVGGYKFYLENLSQVKSYIYDLKIKRRHMGHFQTSKRLAIGVGVTCPRRQSL